MMNSQEKVYRLFDRTIILRLFNSPGADHFFFTMHDNETTSVRAGRRVIRERGGQMLELTHEGTRNIAFRFEGEQFEFDPNRIFSKEGAMRSIQEQSGLSEVPTEVLETVQQFSNWLVNQFQLQQKPVINTLHNTTDDLTVESYQEGGEFQQNASNVHVHPKRNVADFFLVTDQSVFKWLRDRRWNVVLQDDKHVDEDGSLSVWARDNEITYVNVEAGLGHVNIQKSMIAELYEIGE